MPSQLTEKFIEALKHAERTKEVGDLAALFSEEAELQNLAMPEPARGSEGAQSFWHSYVGSFDRIGSEFTNVVESDSSAVLEWRSKGALRDGRAIDYRGISLLETDGEKISRFRTYYDSAAFLTPGLTGRNRSA